MDSSKQPQVLITGAAGFIGGALSRYAIEAGYRAIGVDDFNRTAEQLAWKSIPFQECIDREAFIKNPDRWLSDVKAIFHLGARTDTFCLDEAVLKHLNLDYSKKIFHAAARHKIPFIYASSAAVYGAGEHGYQDGSQSLSQLRPLNPYGQSKLDFDCWAMEQAEQPKTWFGYRFFNVYGFGEHHKSRMASVVWHGYHQIKETGKMNLFRSYKTDYLDGEQRRDFISVNDVIRVLWYSFQQPFASGIYNLGTGTARSFLDLSQGLFSALGLVPKIEFIDMPEGLRDRYQYHTQADMQRFFHSSKYPFAFQSLEDGIATYVEQLQKSAG